MFFFCVFFLKESIDGNMSHMFFQVINDTDADVYQAKGRHGKIYEVDALIIFYKKCQDAVAITALGNISVNNVCLYNRNKLNEPKA